MKIGYYVRSEGRNKGIHVTYGIWETRITGKRGWEFVCSRKATKTEEDGVRVNVREKCVSYKSIEALIEDETRVLDGHAQQLSGLIKALKSNYLIKRLDPSTAAAFEDEDTV